MSAIIWSVLAFVSTLTGGIFTLRFSSKLYLVMGFTAGVLLGVVSFDIFPEIISSVNAGGLSARAPMVALVCGFLIFHVFEKLTVMHHTHETEYASHKHPQVGVVSALALAGHSFMDGVGIGVGFQINSVVGLAVALAVISHDFVDGINTVALMLSHNNTPYRSKWFLGLDAIAPVLGALSTILFVPSENFLTLYLGFFAGFLLYICSSDILPEAHSSHSSLKTVALTILGVLVIFFITQVV